MEEDIYEERRQALLSLVKRLGRGGIKQVADRIGRDPSYVSRLLYPPGKSEKRRIADAIFIALNEAFPGWEKKETQSAKASISLSVNLSETGLSAGAVRLVRLIRQHDKAGTLSPALNQAIEQMMLAATPPKDEAPAQEGRTTPQLPTDMPPKTEPGNEIGYTPNMSQYDPTKKRVAKKPKSQTA